MDRKKFLTSMGLAVLGVPLVPVIGKELLNGLPESAESVESAGVLDRNDYHLGHCREIYQRWGGLRINDLVLIGGTDKSYLVTSKEGGVATCVPIEPGTDTVLIDESDDVIRISNSMPENGLFNINS